MTVFATLSQFYDFPYATHKEVLHFIKEIRGFGLDKYYEIVYEDKHDDEDSCTTGICILLCRSKIHIAV